MKRSLILAVVVVFCLHALSADSFAFWWPFKKKNEEPPAASPASYAIGSIEYEHSYGDAVRAAGAENEFVICETCPKPSGLERLPAPVPVVIRFSAPPSTKAVISAPVTVSTGTQGDLSQSMERSEAAGSVADKVKKGKVENSGLQSAVTPASLVDADQEKAAGDSAKDKGCQTTTIYFSLNSSVVGRDEQRIIIESLDAFAGKNVEILGYTCDLGSKSHNDKLALARAKALAKVLEEKGMKPLAVSGEGKCCYVSEDRRLNRRAEIRCVKGVSR
jgi:outer membrane protein OmpA-like peptidoglycan-associated protein